MLSLFETVFSQAWLFFRQLLTGVDKKVAEDLQGCAAQEQKSFKLTPTTVANNSFTLTRGTPALLSTLCHSDSSSTRLLVAITMLWC